MSQYPVTNQQGVYNAVNYLLSGPSGLGQNFAGFSDYLPVYIKGTFRQPFTIATTATNDPPNWTVPPIAITSGTALSISTATSSTYNVQFSFTPQAKAPFAVGDTVYVANVIDTPFTDNFNGTYANAVVSCTTNTIVLQTQNLYNYGHVTNISSATIEKNNLNTTVSTDANARVSVAGPTQVVFITSQLDLSSITYTCSMASEFDIVVQINRYAGFVNQKNTSDYLFTFDKTVSQQVFTYSTTASGTVSPGQVIFTTVLDQPSFGYWWYICEVSFNNQDQNGNSYPGNAEPGVFTAGLRSLTAQVIKA